MYEDREWVEYLVRPHSAEAARPAGRPRRGGRVPGVRRLGLHHRADPAGGRRHLDRRGARPATAQGMRTSRMRHDEHATPAPGTPRARAVPGGPGGDGAGPRGRAAGGAFPGQYAPPPADRKYPAWPKGCARFEGDERMACLDVVASDFGGLYRYAAANAALAAPQPGESRVVFFGDSITDNWSKAGLRRLLPRQALREPRHRRPDDGADAPALPRRRASSCSRRSS